MRNAALPVVALSVLLVACGEQAPETHLDFQKDLQARLIKAKPGSVIEIPAGTYQLDRSLSLKVSGVTLRGAGMDKTILNFKGQKSGAEGLLVDASDFTIEDLALEDTKGDALKVVGGKNIVIRRVRTEWTNGPATENGAYGIYPVQTEKTLIDGDAAFDQGVLGLHIDMKRLKRRREGMPDYFRPRLRTPARHVRLHRAAREPRHHHHRLQRHRDRAVASLRDQ